MQDAVTWGNNCSHTPITISGPVFADDDRWMASNRDGIRKAAELSEDFLGFHGGINNVSKSFLTLGTWAGDTDDPMAMGFKADWTPLTIQNNLSGVGSDRGQSI